MVEKLREAKMENKVQRGNRTYWFRPVEKGVELFIRWFDGRKWDEGKSYGVFRNEENALLFMTVFTND